MVSVFGPMAADIVHVIGIPYLVTTRVFTTVLAGVLTVWSRSEGTLSIHSIRTRRREKLYRATVPGTFAPRPAVIRRATALGQAVDLRGARRAARDAAGDPAAVRLEEPRRTPPGRGQYWPRRRSDLGRPSGSATRRCRGRLATFAARDSSGVG
jgi:hypothetical protein